MGVREVLCEVSVLTNADWNSENLASLSLIFLCMEGEQCQLRGTSHLAVAWISRCLVEEALTSDLSSPFFLSAFRKSLLTLWVRVSLLIKTALVFHHWLNQAPRDGADPRIRLLKCSRCHLLLAKCFSRVPPQRSADGANDANHRTRNFTELFEES